MGLLGLSGCWRVLGFEDEYTVAEGGSAGDASVGGSNVGGSGGATGGTGGSNVGGSGGATGGSGGSYSCDTCNSLEECWNGQYCVAKKVQVTGGYAIDATEVTRDQYAAWLATNPSTSGQPSYCSWNADFTPAGCEWPPGAKGNHPVVCVDWCDAYAYCAAVGKRLCGKIGGGANAYGDYQDATKSQWYNACSSGGQNNYPYGDTYSGSACNGYDANNGGTVPVGSMSGCESSVSGYTGVYDLSGNVWEWEDSCNGYVDGTNWCRLRGGSVDNDSNLRCDFEYDSYRNYRGDTFGFRCCAP
jgi:formylglycine-generating enzyme required for sulfatase activity